MDELRAFLKPNASQKIKLRGPSTGGIRLTKDDAINKLNRVEHHRKSVVPTGTDYAREIKEKEMQLYLEREMELSQYQSISGGLESIEQLSSFGASIQNFNELTEEAMSQIYSKYTFQTKEETKNLAINDFKQEILDRIASYPVTIIEGPTGCGKTTQVPQWILDNCYQKCQKSKIIVTQPRRIAAISIAKRVAQERGWDVGGLVGHQVGLENKTSNDTRIMYVTTGILLQKLVAAKTLNEYTHIILDEVHERGQEMDFLLIVVKKLLFTVSQRVKVILMSATFNSDAFCDYFSLPKATTLLMSSCVKIEKKDPMFTVKTFYLNDLTKFGSILQDATPKNNEPCIEPSMHHLVLKLIVAFERIDEKEDNYTDQSEIDLPSVLIFLPGINEIEELYACLTDKELRVKVVDAASTKYNWWVLPLHSTITADEQVRVFQRAPPGHRKIILATNIAESSITVPDIKYVVDYCLMKVLVADPETNFTSLQLSWASKANCEQRAGRAGRVRDGRVYRLVQDRLYESFTDECSPEIVRCPLERLVLLAKMLDMGPPSDILALAMDPPEMSNIHRTILVLKEVGAMKKLMNDEFSSSDGEITYLGRIMAKLPLDVRVSKVIMLGYIFGCLEETIIMAAAMSVKNVFSSPFRERSHAYNSKLTWADGSTSDCIAFLNVYRVWNHLRQQQQLKRGDSSQAQWAREFYVQVRALRELDDLVRELRMRLSREGIEVAQQRSPWSRNEQTLALKIILAGAFYPQYFVQVSQKEDRERDAVRTLGGLDPRNTVYLKDFPEHQPHEIYTTAIKIAVKKIIGDEPRVIFDKNSRKIYLSFIQDDHTDDRYKKKSGDPTIPGQVVLPVYKAIKARQQRIDVRIPLLPLDKANALAAAMEANKQILETDKRLPDIDDTHFPLKISQFISVGKFWAQYDDESTMSELGQIQRELNSGSLLAYTDNVLAGQILAAPFTDGALYRVRILKVHPKDMVELLYIDYGSYGRVNVSNLHALPNGVSKSIPALAMRCVLAGVAPAPLLDAHGHWSDQAKKTFVEFVSRGRMLGKVYSVAHGVVSLELLAQDGRVNLNQELLKLKLAVPCEESYESKLNHDIRQTANELNLAQKRAYNKEQSDLSFYELNTAEPLNRKDCVYDAWLKGPFSPLETNLHNLMYASREKQVVVEWNSVNSVLLDTEPQKIYERLLVAADVGQNTTGSKLTLRHTTLMPNIAGLPAIIALLFCPSAELRRDECGMRYVSALCGLGSTEDGAPYFPEHDILVNVDADLSVEDMAVINHIRHLMDFMMYCEPGHDSPAAEDEMRARVPSLLHDNIMNLLKKHRKHREAVTIPNAWEWKSVKDDEVMEPSQKAMTQYETVYPLHPVLDLSPPSREYLLRLKQENDHLKMLVARTPISSNQEFSCKLCGTTPMSTTYMRIHLYSNAHEEREEDLKNVQS